MSDENKSPTVTSADFELLFKSVTIKDGSGDEKPAVRVTASSTSIDLATDRFAKSALVQMAAQFPQMTIFLNHKYNVPEDVFGKVSMAELVERDGFTDLDLEVDVEASNERAVATYNMIKSGTVLGVSIGVLVLDADYVEDETTKGAKLLEITSVHTLEASVVGIPANRRSWVQGALKAASALAGTVVNKKADGTSLIALKHGGEVITVKTIDDEDEEETPEVIATSATPAEPVVPAPEAVAAAADPAAPVEPVVAAASDPEVAAAAKPKVDPEDATDGGADEGKENPDGSKKPKKSFKSAEFLPETAKNLTGDAAARALSDKLYSLVWSMWDALYQAFTANTDIGATRTALQGTIDEFSVVAKRLVESVIDDYYGESPEEDAGETEEKSVVRASLMASFKEMSDGMVALRAGNFIALPGLKTAGVSEEDISRLSHQSAIVIDKNRELAGELATKDAAHAVVVTEKDAVIHGLYECIDMLMEMPVARKTVDTPQQDVGGMADLEDRFPLLDKRILTSLADARVKRASALKQ